MVYYSETVTWCSWDASITFVVSSASPALGLRGNVGESVGSSDQAFSNIVRLKWLNARSWRASKCAIWHVGPAMTVV